MTSEILTQLEAALEDSDNIVESREDYRKLVAVYHCLAKFGYEHLCTRYSPAPSGYCSFQVLTEDARICNCINGDGS